MHLILTLSYSVITFCAIFTKNALTKVDSMTMADKQHITKKNN